MLLQFIDNQWSESLKSPDFTVVPVQVRPRAPKQSPVTTKDIRKAQ